MALVYTKVLGAHDCEYASSSLSVVPSVIRQENYNGIGLY